MLRMTVICLNLIATEQGLFMKKINKKLALIALFFSSAAFSAGSFCDLYHQLHQNMSLDQVKTVVGTQYPMSLKAQTYTWQLPGKAPTMLSFTNDGTFTAALGSIPEQITQLINNKTLTLAQAQQILGTGTVAGEIYSISLPDNKSINISIDINNQVYAIEANIYCP